MKNLLFLYLLVLSPHLFAQNSNIPLDKGLSSSQYNENISNYKKLAKNLSLVNKKLQKEDQNLLLVINETQNNNIDTDEFSSLLLQKQLERLDATTPFNVSHNATIERFIRVYLKDRKVYMNRLLGRSLYYFPYFEQYLDIYDLPLELKYLAVVESALNPLAVSPSGAKGLWQFMYGTGTEYNLQIDSYVDERFDLLKSTKAACVYLKKLYDRFGDWDLALAAYNSGPGNVQKAIKRAGGSTNYWEIRKFLPKETSSYVPAFYATLYLFTHSEYHGLGPKKGEITYAETDTVQLKKSMTFETIKNNTGIELEVLRSFNPIYKKDFIPEVKNKYMSLTLPAHLMTRFLASENKLYTKSPVQRKTSRPSKVIPMTSWNSYLVSDGDNLNSIAKQHKISLEQLKTWNGLDTNFLISGQRLVITDSSLKKHTPEKEFQEQNSLYTVKHGDTLFKISRKLGNISIKELQLINNLQDVNYLKPGTRLKTSNTKANLQI